MARPAPSCDAAEFTGPGSQIQTLLLVRELWHLARADCPAAEQAVRVSGRAEPDWAAGLCVSLCGMQAAQHLHFPAPQACSQKAGECGPVARHARCCLSREPVQVLAVACLQAMPAHCWASPQTRCCRGLACLSRYMHCWLLQTQTGD